MIPNDKTIRDRIVLQHLPLAKSIALRVQQTLPIHVDFEDLLSAGVLGLLDAASKYRPDQDIAFSGYAKHRVRGAILDSLRENDWASRKCRRIERHIEARAREISLREQRLPSISEVAETADRWHHALAACHNRGAFAVSAQRSKVRQDRALDLPADETTQPDKICSRKHLREVLTRVLDALPERLRAVLALYYRAGMTMKQIGAALGVNESRVCQIHKSALARLAVQLQTEGIHSPQSF